MDSCNLISGPRLHVSEIGLLIVFARRPSIGSLTLAGRLPLDLSQDDVPSHVPSLDCTLTAVIIGDYLFSVEQDRVLLSMQWYPIRAIQNGQAEYTAAVRFHSGSALTQWLRAVGSLLQGITTPNRDMDRGTQNSCVFITRQFYVNPAFDVPALGVYSCPRTSTAHVPVFVVDRLTASEVSDVMRTSKHRLEWPQNTALLSRTIYVALWTLWARGQLIN